MVGCLITLACLALELLAKFWPSVSECWLGKTEQPGAELSKMEAAKRRAIRRMAIERLIAEERLYLLLRQRQGGRR